MAGLDGGQGLGPGRMMMTMPFSRSLEALFDSHHCSDWRFVIVHYGLYGDYRVAPVQSASETSLLTLGTRTVLYCKSMYNPFRLAYK